jgi:hypothetical protein
VLERVHTPPVHEDLLLRFTELPAGPVYLPVELQPAPATQLPEPDDETVRPLAPVVEPERV